MNCARFRRRSLRAHSMLLDIVRTHGQITVGLKSNMEDQNPLICDSVDNNINVTGLNKRYNEDDTYSNSVHIYENIKGFQSKIDNVQTIDNDSENGMNYVDLNVVKPETCDNLDNQEKLCVENIPEDDVTKLDNIRVCSNSLNKDTIVEDLVKEENMSNLLYLGDEVSVNDIKMEYTDVSPEFQLSRGYSMNKPTIISLSEEVVLDVVKIDEQQPPEADGLSTDNTLCCDICHYQTDSKIQLLKHLKAHAGRKKRNFDTCDSNKHLKSKYYCNICKKVFKRKKSLTYHMKKHSDEKPYSCDICERSFRKPQYLRNHLLIHYDEKPHTCHVCNRSFRRVHHLQSHFVIHSSEKMYSCNTCKKTFNRRNVLTEHLKIHSSEMRYSCDFCEKTFSNNNYLRTHLRTHLKQYGCDICDHLFSRKDHLLRHLRTHSGEKPYICDVCKRSFSLKHQLQRHVQLHSTERKYSCDICKKTFWEEDEAQRHQKRHQRRRQKQKKT